MLPGTYANRDVPEEFRYPQAPVDMKRTAAMHVLDVGHPQDFDELVIEPRNDGFRYLCLGFHHRPPNSGARRLSRLCEARTGAMPSIV